MPSVFSPSLRIEEIASGEASGTWGVLTNNNLGNLIEQAIAYTTSIDVTSGNVTLTSLNGLLDQARSAVLEVTGTPGVTRAITIPNTQKTYTVRNRTANITQVKTASGTAFDCPALSDSYLVCNGSNGVAGRSITDGANAITSLAAPFTSPAFSGVPTAPTAAQGTNTTQLATTAFVNTEIASDTANLAPLASPALTGIPTAPTAAQGTNTTQLATTAFVNSEIASDTANLAPLDSPELTGIPTAPTAALGDTTNQLATTAFVASTVAYTLPAGGIIMWSGSIASIPVGWLLCNGASGTPDLQDRFVVGAGSTYAVNTVGGAASNTLIIDNLPAHDHTGSGTTGAQDTNHTHTGTTGNNSAGHSHDLNITSGGQSANHNHGVSDPGHAHSIRFSNRLLYNGGGGNPNTAWGGDITNSTEAAFTSISIGNNSVDHTHNVSGTTGGQSANHTHTITTGDNSVNHAHSYSFTTSSVGLGTAIENRPPYYALAYIMKT